MFLLGWRVGAAQTKALLRGRNTGGSQQVRARYSHKEKDMTLYQKKCHICTVKQEVFRNMEGQNLSDLKSVLKTKTDCTVFGTMISAR